MSRRCQRHAGQPSRGMDVLLLGVAKAPLFIALNALRFDANDRVEVMYCARVPSLLAKSFTTVLIDVSRSPLNRPHRHAFAKKAEDLDALGERQFVHNPN